MTAEAVSMGLTLAEFRVLSHESCNVHGVQVVESGPKPTAPLVLRKGGKDSYRHRWSVRIKKEVACHQNQGT